MKYGKKILLLPPNPVSLQLDELDEQMSKILNSKGLSVDEKLKHYEQVLQRYLSINNKPAQKEKTIVKTQPSLTQETEPETVESIADMSDVASSKSIKPIKKSLTTAGFTTKERDIFRYWSEY
jgi:hypothetical protein